MTYNELQQSMTETRDAVVALSVRFDELSAFCEQVQRDAIACLAECDQIAAKIAEQTEIIRDRLEDS